MNLIRELFENLSLIRKFHSNKKCDIRISLMINISNNQDTSSLEIHSKDSSIEISIEESGNIIFGDFKHSFPLSQFSDLDEVNEYVKDQYSKLYLQLQKRILEVS